MKNFFNKKTASIFSMLAVATILISSCKNDDPEPVVYGSAKIRVVNAVNGSSAQDFYQGNTKMSTTAVAYGEFSSYLTISAGNSTISFKNAGTTTTTVSQNIGAYTDASYTAFTASNSAGGVQIVGFEDDTVVPASGKAKVRFVNLGPAFNNTINVTATSGAIVTGLQLGFASAYSTVDITSTLSVNVVGAAVSGVVPVTLESGKIYTIWLDAATATTANIHVIKQN